MSSETVIERIHNLVTQSFVVNSSLKLDEIKTHTVQTAMKLLNAGGASLLFRETASGRFHFHDTVGLYGKGHNLTYLERGVGLSGWVAENKSSIIYNTPRIVTAVNSNGEHVEFVIRNIISTPIISDDEVIGVVQVINKNEGLFTENDITMLSLFSGNVGYAVNNATMHNTLKDLFLKTVSMLAETIELKRPDFPEHASRVSAHCRRLGKRLKFDDEQLFHLELASILHDIGKIGVPESILRKNGRLTLSEKNEVRKHTLYGVSIIEKSGILHGIVPAVRHHHEWYDGSGYPDGLSGSAIDPLARIISVCDAYVSMTMDRPFKKGITQFDAFLEIKKYTGTQFDPHMVELFFDSFVERLK